MAGHGSKCFLLSRGSPSTKQGAFNRCPNRVSQGVALHAGLFGLAHLSARDFPQLMALGIVMGFSYVRSRNLLTPMMIHGAWNGTVLTILFLLVQAGVNIEDIL